jgi:hypothetical protein
MIFPLQDAAAARASGSTGGFMCFRMPHDARDVNAGQLRRQRIRAGPARNWWNCLSSNSLIELLMGDPLIVCISSDWEIIFQIIGDPFHIPGKATIPSFPDHSVDMSNILKTNKKRFLMVSETIYLDGMLIAQHNFDFG